jgi:hypothetical protein
MIKIPGWRNGWILILILLCVEARSESPEEKIISQNEWNPGVTPADIGKMVRHSGGITSIVIHHTQTPNEPAAMERARLRNIREYHKGDRGWGEVAYHYFVGATGTIYEGRSWQFQGSSGTKYDLDGRLLICLLGDFSERLPSAETLDTLVTLVAEKLHEHKLTPDKVLTHQMAAATDCPGAAMQKWFEDTGVTAIKNAYGAGKAAE